MERPAAKHSYHVRRRFGRAQDSQVTDPYRQTAKPAGPAVCSDCHAVYSDGRWQWAEVPPQSESVICQACHRARDNYPAGEVRLSGAFVAAHRDELASVARHAETAENKEHPLNRIMNIAHDGDAMVITTTDIHLPRRIGRSLHRAYRGKLEVHFDPGAHFVRVTWVRALNDRNT